jgi:hypothetical protein
VTAIWPKTIVLVMFRTRFLAPAAALVLSLSVLVPHVSAQERPPVSVAQAADGALYVITPLGRYALVPEAISDEELAALPDLGSLSGGMIGSAAPPPSTPMPVATPAPVAPVETGSRVPTVVDVAFANQGQGVSGRAFTVAGMIENLSTSALSHVPVQLNLYDTTDALVQTDTAYVSLKPLERRGFATNVYMDAPHAIARVSATPLEGRVVDSAQAPSVKVGEASLRGNHASAIVTNTGDKDIRSLLFDAVGFDTAGKVIGGGLALASALPAGGEAHIETDVNSGKPPARVEFYPDW